MPARFSHNPGEEPNYVLEKPVLPPRQASLPDEQSATSRRPEQQQQDQRPGQAQASAELEAGTTPPSRDREPVADDPEAYAEPRSHTGRRVGMVLVAALFVVGGGNTVANWVKTADKASIERDANGVLGRILGRTHTSPPAEENTDPTDEAPAPTESTHTTTAKAKPTTTSKPTASAKVPALVVPPVAACVEATPTELKVAQQLMLPVSSNANMTELISLQKKYPTNYTITGSFDITTLKQLQNVWPGIRSRLTTNNEGGAAQRVKNADGTTLPSQADIEAGKVKGADLEKLLTSDLTNLKNNGIYMNLAPVVDVAKAAGQEKGRMFTTEKAAEAYLRIYLDIAKHVGVYATLKHFPSTLSYGNTNIQAKVETANYAELEKSGALKPYALLNTKDNKNWAMMSSAHTAGLPDKKLDNGMINVFNPAAYVALDKLTGDAPVITDAIGPGVASLKGVPVEKAVVNAWTAGANMALISGPNTGMTITQQFDAILQAAKSAEKNGGLDPKAFDASYLKVLGNKGLTACNVLKAYDAKAYDELTKPKPTATATPTTKPAPKSTSTVEAPATGTPMPGKSLPSTAKPMTAAAGSTSIKATSTGTSQKIIVKNTATAVATK